jgi:hypothetical protein
MIEQTYFAQIDDENIVIDVRVVSAEYMAENPELYVGEWVQTYIDVANKTYAGLGYTYDPATDNFYAPITVVNP